MKFCDPYDIAAKVFHEKMNFLDTEWLQQNCGNKLTQFYDEYGIAIGSVEVKEREY